MCIAKYILFEKILELMKLQNQFQLRQDIMGHKPFPLCIQSKSTADPKARGINCCKGEGDLPR